MMKALSAGIILAAIVGSGFFWWKKQGVEISKEQFVFEQRDYRSQKLVPIAGEKYLVLNFWASWCPPCIAETPSLIKSLAQKKSEYRLILISQDSDIKNVEDFVKTFPDISENKIQIIYDESRSLSQMFGVFKLPETFFVNLATHKIIQVSGSQNWEDPMLITEVEKSLNK